MFQNFSSFKVSSFKVVTLSTKDNVKLTKQLNEGFKRLVYRNEYKSKIDLKDLNNNEATDIRIYLDAYFQGVKRLFVLAFDDTNNGANKVERNSYRKHFLPKLNITKYNVLIDGRNFYDQPINDRIKKYEEVRKIAMGQGDDYTTRCLLNYQYFRYHNQLITIDLNKRKELDAHSRAIQQIELYGKLDTKSQVRISSEKSKETVLELYKGTAKVL